MLSDVVASVEDHPERDANDIIDNHLLCRVTEPELGVREFKNSIHLYLNWIANTPVGPNTKCATLSVS